MEIDSIFFSVTCMCMLTLRKAVAISVESLVFNTNFNAILYRLEPSESFSNLLSPFLKWDDQNYTPCFGRAMLRRESLRSFSRAGKDADCSS